MRVVFFLIVSSMAHFLAARWLLAVSPRLRAKKKRVYQVAAGLAAILALVRLLAVASRGHVNVHLMMMFAMVELSIVGFSLPWLGLLTLLARGIGRAFDAIKPVAKVAKDDAEIVAIEAARISRREAIERIGGASILASTTVALGWGAIRGRHAFQLDEVVFKIAGWPKALDGYVIAQCSDIHVGEYVGDRELDEGFELVKRFRPDIIVATGDLVDFRADAVHPILKRLSDVNARDGAFAILGNHDHYADADSIARRIDATDVKLLANTGVRIRPNDGGGFALLGVDDYQGRGGWSKLHKGPDLGRAIAAVQPDLPRILLAHQPRFFVESQGRVQLQLSGHTHGGQINPGYSPASAIMEFVAGRYERAGSSLYVNRGFGVVGPPARVGAPPEITKIIIVSA